MGKIFKIGFVLIVAVFLLGGGIVGAGKARAIEYREGECIKDDSSCNLSDCGVKNIYGKDYGCLSGYACGLYSPESGGQKNTCIKLLEGETLLIQTSRPTDLNLCIEETGGMGIRNSVEKRGLPPEAYTFQIFGNQFIMCQSGYKCLNNEQCMDEDKYNQIVSGSLECVIDNAKGEGGDCVGKYFSGGKYTPCTTNSGNNGCLKSKICTDSLQCTPLMNNECIPGTTNCRGDTINGSCKNKKSIGEGREYTHGCLEDKVNNNKSLCIQQGDKSGGCTDIIDFSSYDSIQQAGVYYNSEGLPFICGDNDADLKMKDNKQSYITITADSSTQCPDFSFLQFQEKIEWDKNANAYKTQKSGKYLSDATEKPEIQTLLQSQCIGPLADGCKGKSAVQQFLTSTFGNVIITILSVIFGLAHTLFGILLALIMSVMGWVLSSFDVTAVSALSTFWAYIRDLCNLLFIVILLYIAFATVLRINAGQVKKMLPSFLLAAILINFSKQIAFIILDVGEFFTQTLVKLLPQNWSTASGLMSGISEAAGVKNWFMPPVSADRDFADFAPVLGGLIIGIIFQFVFILAVGLATVLLVVRIVVLWLLIIVSPLPYAAKATGMPSLQGFVKKWWSWFLKAVFFAPAMVFCLVVAVALLTDKGAMGDPELIVYQNQNEVQQSLDPRIQGAQASQNVYAANSSQSNFQEIASGIDPEAQAAASLQGVSMEGMLRLLLATVFVFAGLSAARMASSFGAGFAVQGADKLMNKAKGAAMKWGVKKPGKAIGKLAAWPVTAPTRRAGGALRRGWAEKVTKKMSPLKYAAYKKKVAGEVKDAEGKIENLDDKQLKRIAQGKLRDLGLDALRLSPKEKQRFIAAAKHKMADKGKVPHYNASTTAGQEDIKKYIRTLERQGGSRSRILANRPDWAGALIDNPANSVEWDKAVQKQMDKNPSAERWRNISANALKNDNFLKTVKFQDYQNISKDKKMNNAQKRKLLTELGNNLHTLYAQNKTGAEKVAKDTLLRAGRVKKIEDIINISGITQAAGKTRVAYEAIDPSGAHVTTTYDLNRTAPV